MFEVVNCRGQQREQMALKKKRTLTSIRKKLGQELKKLAKADGVSLLGSWFPMHPAAESAMVNWKSEELGKVMKVDEYEGEGWNLSCWMDKSGLMYELDTLSVSARNCDENAGVIYDLYKAWFLKNTTPKRMEKLIERYEAELNKEVRPAKPHKDKKVPRLRKVKNWRGCGWPVSRKLKLPGDKDAKGKVVLYWYKVSSLRMPVMLMGWKTIKGVTGEDVKRAFDIRFPVEGCVDITVARPMVGMPKKFLNADSVLAVNWFRDRLQELTKEDIYIDKYYYILRYESK